MSEPAKKSSSELATLGWIWLWTTIVVFLLAMIGELFPEDFGIMFWLGVLIPVIAVVLVLLTIIVFIGYFIKRR